MQIIGRYREVHNAVRPPILCMMETCPGKNLDFPASLAATGQQDVCWNSCVRFLESSLEERLNQLGAPLCPSSFSCLEYWCDGWSSSGHLKSMG